MSIPSKQSPTTSQGTFQCIYCIIFTIICFHLGLISQSAFPGPQALALGQLFILFLSASLLIRLQKIGPWHIFVSRPCPPPFSRISPFFAFTGCALDKQFNVLDVENLLFNCESFPQSFLVIHLCFSRYQSGKS